MSIDDDGELKAANHLIAEVFAALDTLDIRRICDLFSLNSPHWPAVQRARQAAAARPKAAN